MIRFITMLAILTVGMVQAQTGILTVDGQDYTVTGSSVGVDCAAEYARGYDAGVTPGIIISAAVRIDNHGEVDIMYETNLDFSIGAINPLVRVTVLSSSNHGGVVFFQSRLSALASREFIGLGDIHAPTEWNRFEILIMNEHGAIARRENLPTTYINRQ